jgi:hypothetical protein
MRYSRIGWSFCLFGALSFISLATAPRAEAATYTYTLTGGFSGSITTTCDSCALNASTITAWSISAGGTGVSSTTPGAQLTVPAGDTDLQATPSGITFSFAGSFGALTFSTPAASIRMSDVKNGAGTIQGCTPAGGCTVLASGAGSETLSIQSTPFAGTVTYNFTGIVLGDAYGIYEAAFFMCSGTYTFDLAAGNGALPVSFSAPWTSFSANTSPRVFGSTFNAGSVTFSDAGSVSNNTSVAGAALAGATVPSEYLANDTEFSSATNSVQHTVQLIGGMGAKAPYDANGLPVFANVTNSGSDITTFNGRGSLIAYSGGAAVAQLNYILTSLVPVTTAVSLSPATLNFANVPVGTTSAPLTATLTNTGAASLIFTGFNLGSQNGNNEFELVQNNCGSALAVNASCTLVFTLTPISLGAKQDTFTITDSATGSPQTLTLTGMAGPTVQATFNDSAVPLSWENQEVGTSSERAFVAYNNNTVPLTISSVSIVGAQANNFVLRNACAATLPAGRSCAIFVTFKPLLAGPISATLSFVDNGPGDASAQQSLLLFGHATAVPAPLAKLNTTSLSFASEPVGASSTARAVIITNAGNAPLNISSVSINGAQANEFELQDACVSSLPAGRSCSLLVTFKPLIAGAASASLSIVDNDTGSPQLVPLTGSTTTMSEPVAKLSTKLLSFPNTPSGTVSAEKAVVLTNTGTAALNLSSVTLGGYFPDNFSLRNACVPSLPAGHNCVLFVTFKPQSVGTWVASLSIVDNATGSTQSVTLTGTGT